MRAVRLALAWIVALTLAVGLAPRTAWATSPSQVIGGTFSFTASGPGSNGASPVLVLTGAEQTCSVAFTAPGSNATITAQVSPDYYVVTAIEGLPAYLASWVTVTGFPSSGVITTPAAATTYTGNLGNTAVPEAFRFTVSGNTAAMNGTFSCGTALGLGSGGSIGAVTQGTVPWVIGLNSTPLPISGTLSVAFPLPGGSNTTAGAGQSIGIQGYDGTATMKPVLIGGSGGVLVQPTGGPWPVTTPNPAATLGIVNQGTTPWVISTPNPTATLGIVNQGTSPWIVNLPSPLPTTAAGVPIGSVCDKTTLTQCVAVSSGGVLSVTTPPPGVNPSPLPTTAAGVPIGSVCDKTTLTQCVAVSAAGVLSVTTPNPTSTIGIVNQGTTPWVVSSPYPLPTTAANVPIGSLCDKTTTTQCVAVSSGGVLSVTTPAPSVTGGPNGYNGAYSAPANYVTPAALATGTGYLALATAAINVAGVYVNWGITSTAGTCWISLYDTASAPTLGTAVVAGPFYINTASAGNFAVPIPPTLKLAFSNGLAVGITTTPTGSTVCNTTASTLWVGAFK
jgi:hypothetical protein